MGDLLNDIFSNNIEFVAKQLQTFVDFLYPSSDDNSQTPVEASGMPLIITGQTQLRVGQTRVNNQNMYLDAWYNVSYNSMTQENAFYWFDWANDYPQANINAFEDVADVNSFYLQPYAIGTDELLQYSGSHFYSRNKVNYGGTGSQVSGGATIASVSEYIQKNLHVFFAISGRRTEFASNQINLYLDKAPTNKMIIITKNINTAVDIYNNYIYYDNDYHTSNTYNYNGGSGDGGGDVYVGGGAGGLVVCPVGAVGYADIELALDSFIHDLNLNFGDSDNIYPFDDFPSYNEIKYKDMGDFYIQPIDQYDKLPTAPTFDGSIDVKDYPLFVANSTTSFLDLLPVSISAFLCAAVVISLLIGKIQH